VFPALVATHHDQSRDLELINVIAGSTLQNLGKQVMGLPSKSGTDKAGTVKSGIVKVGTVKSGTDKAGTDKASTGKVGTGKAGTDKSGTDKSGTDKAGTDKAGTDKAGTDKAGTDKAGTVKAGTVKAIEILLHCFPDRLGRANHLARPSISDLDCHCSSFRSSSVSFPFPSPHPHVTRGLDVHQHPAGFRFADRHDDVLSDTDLRRRTITRLACYCQPWHSVAPFCTASHRTFDDCCTQEIFLLPQRAVRSDA
jgi:uncharacterized low-complexity protein